MTTKWVNEASGITVGELVFVVEVSPQSKAEYSEARVTPGRTNMSNEAKLRGWLGDTNNVSRHARGAGRIMRRSRRDDSRVLVELLSDDDAAVVDAMHECAS